MNLAKLRFLAKSELLLESDSRVSARLRPSGASLPELLETAHQPSWQMEQLTNDEGRLDDVFRAITLPDTERGSSS